MKRARRWAGFLLAFLLGILGVTSCVSTPPEPEEVGSEEPEPEPSETERYRCPLDGLAVESEDMLSLRPVAISVDNHPNARPQQGLSEACIVYELPTEGGITRYLALFKHGLPSSVGPVRSARHYFLDYAGDYGAVLVHAGGSPMAKKDLADRNFPSLNDMSGDPVFRRTSDRKMPHNLYTEMPKIRETLEKRGLEGVSTDSLPFHLGEAGSGTPAKSISIKYPGEGPSVEYLYDAAESAYLRKTGKVQDVDALSETPICPRNVVVQFVKAWVIPGDPEGRLDMETYGQGRLLVFSGGSVREGLWRKASRFEPPVFLDEAGDTFILSPGQTWVEVVTDKTSVSYQND